MKKIEKKKDIYDKIFERLIELCPDIKDLTPGDYRKSESPGFMDLHLTVIEKNKDSIKFSLSHTYLENGDTIPDPDMEIKLYLTENWKKAEALNYQDRYRFDLVYPVIDGKKHIDSRIKQSLNMFLLEWLRNIINQRHSLKKKLV